MNRITSAALAAVVSLALIVGVAPAALADETPTPTPSATASDTPAPSATASDTPTPSATAAATTADAPSAVTISGHVSLGSSSTSAGSGDVSVSSWTWNSDSSDPAAWGWWVSSAGATNTAAALTDASGNYSIAVRSNSYVVIAFDYVGAGNYVDTTSLLSHFQQYGTTPLTAGVTQTRTTALTGVNTLMAAGGAISGVATDKVPASTSGILVTAAWTSDSGIIDSYSTHAAADGSYSITGLPAGSYRVDFAGNEVSGPIYDLYWGASAAHPEGISFALAAGASKKNISVTLQSLGAVVGSVSCDDCVVGQTALVSIEAQDQTSKAWVALAPEYAQTNSTFRFERLLAGTYRVNVHYTGTKHFDDLVTSPIVLSAGEVSNQTLTLQRAPVTSTGVSKPVSAFLTALYQDFLSRKPGAAEVSAWASVLAKGANRGVVAQGFVDSDEYRLIRIDQAYRTVLGREPDAAGRQSWLDGMHRGELATDDVAKKFYASDEFYSRSGGSNAGLVNGIYQQVLGRSASNDEQNYWTQTAFDHANSLIKWWTFPPGTTYQVTIDRSWMIDQIYGSVEAARSRVSAMYQLYLGRVPDEPGLQGWALYDLQAGDSAVRSGMTASDEYYALASKRYSGS